ncbi:MAG: hypothetical protein JW928_05600 [Candidatus Aureabacteria bacterium]|nr:hypothetical protein [Candidatus Auribacterota bacterium]
MQRIKYLLIFFILTGLLFCVSFQSKKYLSSSEQSIVKEFINIPFAMRMSKLLFMDHTIAASQYYQFLAVIYSTKLNFPHYHMTGPGHEEHHHGEKHHHHEGTSPEGEKYVAYRHGPGGRDIPMTQKEVDEMAEREKYITAHVSEFIDIDYFYDLIDLSNALDESNDYILLFGRGWALNVDMARKMIEVLKNSYQRDPRWRTMFDAGWIALYNLRDYEEARKYLKAASNHRDAPEFVSVIYAYSFYVDKKYEAAIYQIARQMNETEDHNLKTRLEKNLEWYQSLLFLNRAAKAYRDHFGKDIESLNDLITSGLVKDIPQDRVGKGFIWDAENREVVSQNVYDLVKK